MVAAESLVKQLSDDHQITLVSRSHRFLFYPALVRLAFGRCEPDDVSFDLRTTMLTRRVNFIEAEVAHIDPVERKVIIAHGEVQGSIPYDYLIFALGRRLATEHVTGFFEHANHLLDLDGALKFGEAIRNFDGGRAVIGQCPEARLPVPVYETAFALSRWLEENGDRQSATITVVSPTSIRSEFEDDNMETTLSEAMEKQHIEYLPNFPISRIGSNAIETAGGHELDYSLLMLLPPFRGSSAISRLGITNEEGYVNADWTMKVIGIDRVYAVGDCVNFAGPKMGHMAVHQGEVAAANLVAEIAGHEPVSHYHHDVTMVLDAGDRESIYFHKDLWADDPASIRHGRFWSWAKRVHERYWEAVHA